MSKRIYIWIFVCLAGAFVLSCDSGPDFLKSTGEVVDIEVDLVNFHTISAIDEVDVYVQVGPQQKVVIRAGENLVEKIGLSVADQILTITNQNRFSWIRKAGNPELHITIPFLKRVEIYDYINIYGLDTLYAPNFEIYSYGTGDISLLLNVDSLDIKSEFISVIEVKGKTGYLHAESTKDSKFFLSGLKADIVEVDHNGSNRIDVFPISSLTGTLKATGDLIYYNKPAFLDVNVQSSGQVIAAEQ